MSEQPERDLYETDREWVEAWQVWANSRQANFVTNRAINEWTDRVFSTMRRDDPLRPPMLPELDQ